MPACRIDWAAVAMRRSIMVRYYVTTAAGKVAINWIQLCYNLRTATCALFTNLTRWKFPYENHLVEISRESYNILAYSSMEPIAIRHQEPAVAGVFQTQTQDSFV